MNGQEELLKTAEENLAAARHLLKGEMYNQAVARAYYSAFAAAKSLLLGRLAPENSPGRFLRARQTVQRPAWS